jgi:thiamine-phosphate pyrophosphorylase
VLLGLPAVVFLLAELEAPQALTKARTSGPRRYETEPKNRAFIAFSRIMVRVRGLYPIVDLEILARAGLSPLEFAREILVARPELLQLRAKSAKAREVLSVLLELRGLCRDQGTRLIMNDRVDLALLGEVDGVHVGQSDLEIADVRRLSEQLIVGVSTHSLTELRAALETAPDYVAIGPVFQTSSKLDTEPVLGLDVVREAQALAARASCPLFAIGGLGAEHLAELASLGVGAAVISALMPPDGGLGSVRERALALALPYAEAAACET